MTDAYPGSPPINVWLLEIDDTPALIAGLRDLLDAAERERAGRFRAAVDSNAYITARAAARLLLARATGADARSMHLVAGSHGKPALLTSDGSPSASHFNLSHSGQRVLLAISAAGPVGVDIEARRPVPDALAVARRFFSASEAAALAATAPERQPDAFLRVWTRKEAYLKAHGTGLSGGLGSFSVSLAADAPAEWFADPADPAGWTLAPLAVPDGYFAAIAWHGGARGLSMQGPFSAAHLLEGD